jgi:hypothetical protein
MSPRDDSVPLVVEEAYLMEVLLCQSIHLGRCQARCCSRAFPKGIQSPQLRFWASWGRATPASFDAHSWGTYPPGWRLFQRYPLSDATLPKAGAAKPFVPSSVEIAHTLEHTEVFLPPALRWRTRTLFSCSRYYQEYSRNEVMVQIYVYQCMRVA